MYKKNKKRNVQKKTKKKLKGKKRKLQKKNRKEIKE